MQEVWSGLKHAYGLTLGWLEMAKLLTEAEAKTLRPQVRVQTEWLSVGGGVRSLPPVPEPE